jgi:hypothetical protein
MSKLRLSLLLLLFTISIFIPQLPAQDKNAKAFNKDLLEGYEVATVVDSLTSPDGKMAVLYTARKKELKAASGWPVVYPGVNIGETDAPDENLYTTENWVVSLPEKKKLGLVRSTQPGFIAIYPNSQLYDGLLGNGFSALWGPEQEGWHYGLLNYDARWGCCDIFLVNSDGTEAKITSIRAALEAAVRGHLTQKKIKGAKVASFVVGYKLLGLDRNSVGSAVADPLGVRIGFLAEVPKSDTAPYFEGVLSVRLARSAKGVASASVTGIKDGAAPPEVPPAAPAPDFAAFRKEWNAKAEKGDWKVVRKDLPSPGKGRKAYIRGWVEAYVLQRLVHVETLNAENEIITLYYWKEGQLTSVFEFRKGEYAQISDVAEATETYNFVDEKLVSWFRTGDTDVVADPKEEGFQEKGEEVLKQSIDLAQPIYQAIGAD